MAPFLFDTPGNDLTALVESSTGALLFALLSRQPAFTTSFLGEAVIVRVGPPNFNHLVCRFLALPRKKLKFLELRGTKGKIREDASPHNGCITHARTVQAAL